MFASLVEIDGVENLQCFYETKSFTLWPQHQSCRVDDVDLSSNQKLQEYSFSLSRSGRKGETKTVWFSESPNTIEFIPMDIFREFPLLSGIIITSSNIPILKNDLFISAFIKIEFLYLYNDQIQAIETDALQELLNLKWLCLYSNKIQNLDAEIFRSNVKLEFFNFEFNQVASANPKLFKNLSKLRIIVANGNVCTSEKIGCETCFLSQSEINHAFKKCFSECRLEYSSSPDFMFTTPEIPVIETETETTADTYTHEMETVTETKTETGAIDSTSTLYSDITKSIKKKVTKLSSELLKLEEKAAEKFGTLKEYFLKLFF